VFTNSFHQHKHMLHYRNADRSTTQTHIRSKAAWSTIQTDVNIIIST